MNIYFANTWFGGYANFDVVRFGGEIYFDGAHFNNVVTFRKVRLIDESDLEGAMLAGFTYLVDNLDLNNAVLSFRRTKFADPQSQEYACRLAKNILSKTGNRVDEEYYFYREMEGKRKQKPWYFRYSEYVFIQFIIGYGVRPWRLFACWLLFIIAFAVIYQKGNGMNGTAQFVDYMKISFSTAVAPGYIANMITSGNTTAQKLTPQFQVVAMIEMIFGTILWAGFIATFARKYMR